MSDPGTPTFDQLRVFVAVVEAGSFAGAARTLGRATSVISYAIANLENQLGVMLFDREATKRPVLTEAGRMVLAEARVIAGDIDGLRAKVKALSQGLEPEIHLALDVMLPAARVVDTLRALAEAYPTVALRLHVEALGAVTQRVLEGAADLGVAGPFELALDRLERIGVGSVDLIPVAAPSHPLAQAGANAPGASRDHIQLVLTDRSTLTSGQDFAVSATHTWRLADLGAKHMLLREGIGWGNMPEPMVREDIAAGRLARLDLPEGYSGQYRFHAIYRSDSPPGPAARFLIERLVGQTSD